MITPQTKNMNKSEQTEQKQLNTTEIALRIKNLLNQILITEKS